jgi:tetratricopeptide (TPR) repeat protein
MAKAKKNSKFVYRPSAGFGMKQTDVVAAVRRISRLFIEGHDQQASHQIFELCQQFPDRLEPHELMAEIGLELEDTRLCGKAFAQLMQLQPQVVDYAYGFGSVMLQDFHPLLAHEAMQRVLQLNPDSEMRENATATVAQIDRELPHLLEQVAELPQAEGIEILRLHEWAQLYLEWREYDHCRDLELQVLQRQPNMLPALNNLSLVAFIQDDIRGAIAESEKVLAIAPDNIHALSNLVRYYVMLGEMSIAQTLAVQLQQANTETAWNPWMKKVEGLSYVGDDAAIVKLWKQLKRKPQERELLPDTAVHLFAVALANQGQIAEAQRLWQEVLNRSPHLKIVQENFNNSLQPVANRHRAWPFTLDSWMTQSLHQSLAEELSPIATAHPERLSDATRRFFQRHPEAIYSVNLILRHADPASCSAMISLLKQADQPDLWAMLHTFALGQQGSDQMRYQAAIGLVEGGKLNPEKVSLWLQGKWQEVSLINYEFHDESPYKHSRKVQRLLEEALPLLRLGTETAAGQAEILLQQALTETRTPDLLNNLACAYKVQGRKEEAQSIFEQLIQDYPQYIPARVSLAQEYLSTPDLDAADALLKPIVKHRRFHYNDFAMFSEVYIPLLLQQGETQAAQTWWQMWEQVMPDHPRLAHWESALGFATLADKVKKLITSESKSRRSTAKKSTTTPKQSATKKQATAKKQTSAKKQITESEAKKSNSKTASRKTKKESDDF